MKTSAANEAVTKGATEVGNLSDSISVLTDSAGKATVAAGAVAYGADKGPAQNQASAAAVVAGTSAGLTEDARKLVEQAAKIASDLEAAASTAASEFPLS